MRMCSTPYGINGRNTRVMVNSTSGSPACSTPYGINGRNTGLAGILRVAQQVLNALRHQRKEHARTARCVPPEDQGAQRLTASTEGTRATLGITVTRNSVLNALRHQRKEHCCSPLSASRSIRVLNALRHQRKEHGCRSILQFLGEFVLNALRHQRKEHSVAGAGVALVLMCSTPYGINGRNTASNRSAVPQSRSAQRLTASTEGTPDAQFTAGKHLHVLNALRHQRKEHSEPTPHCTRSIMCSTPYGINGRNTTGVGLEISGNVMCSTPYGINGRNTPVRGR